jgi:hypothetical protein
VYRVLLNRKEGRILVTGREGDLRLLEEGWELVYESSRWSEAFAFAIDVANDETIEWYYDDSVSGS